MRLLISTSRTGMDAQQQVAVLALGHIHSSCHRLVIQESLALLDDYLTDRQMPRVRTRSTRT